MDREQALDTALGQIERPFGKGSVMKMSDRPQVSVGAVSTGSLALDLALGIGGLPRGRIVEIFGPESSGKTTLVYHVIAEAQRRGGICAFIDAEHAMDPSYANRIGVDIDELLVSQPDTGEQALEITELLIRSGALDVVAIDSVAALTPKAEIEGEMGDSHVGLQARLMSQALRKLAGHAQPHRHDLHLHEPAAREDRRHVRQPGDDPGRPRAEVLRVGAARHPPDRDAQGRRRGDRQPRAREGGEEQGRAAVQAGGVRHPLRLRDLLGGHGARRRARAEDRPEVRLVLQLRGRAARPGPPERDRVPARASRRDPVDPAADPGAARRGPDRLRPAAAGRGARPTRRRRRRRRRRPQRPPARSRAGEAVEEAVASSSARRRASALDRAVRALARRDHSVASLRAKLARAGVSSEAQAEAHEMLERAGYVDDARFAAARAEHLAARGYGDEGIRADLDRRGVRRGRRRGARGPRAQRRSGPEEWANAGRRRLPQRARSLGEGSRRTRSRPSLHRTPPEE